MELQCLVCCHTFKVKPYRMAKAKYCSSECYGKTCKGKIPKSAFLKGQHISPNTQYKSGTSHRYYGISSGAKGKHWNLSLESRERQSKARKGEIKLEMRGKKHWNWQGGKRTLRRQAMSRVEYKDWRRQCMKRDDFTCQECGQYSGLLQVDHIKPWALFPELRYILSNGRTLCLKCHRATDTWGGRTYSMSR